VPTPHPWAGHDGGAAYVNTFGPWYQMHGSIGPSCALAMSGEDGVTVWTHTQGVFSWRAALAQLLRLPSEQVRCVHVEGSGRYGHNGADDVAADAALIARAMPAGRFARSGCASRSTRASRMGRRWWPRCPVRSMLTGASSIGATALSLSVEHETGRVRLSRVVAAVDSGQPINPDGIRNQIEGAMAQAASWTLYEQAHFDRRHITSTDWSGYPILRFPAAPESVEVHVLPRPGLPFLGTGETGQGPMAAAIANALHDAAGVLLRDLPLSSEHVKAAIGM
jgi:CO/xanthine dehydrogenase Mo-binding subunit